MMKTLLFTLILACLIMAAPACYSRQPAVNQSDVVPAQQVRVVSFVATPSKIENGSVVRLQWDVSNADSVVIDNGIGEVPSKGSLEVRPYELTAYNLTAKNSGGSVASAVFVNVTPFIRVSSPASNLPESSDGKIIGGLPHLNANEEYVFFQGAVMVGADDHLIVLRNNPQAHNPTWDELKSFLKDDATDRHLYQPGRFTCGDFAEMLHNNAEAAGIRAAIVAIELISPSIPGGIINHSLDAFETTDRGLVYIDDTSSSSGFFADKQANVVVGEDYVCVSLVQMPGQLQTWPSMGKVKAVDIFQW
jgi:hypothetical protein